jgi:hypothetical protein
MLGTDGTTKDQMMSSILKDEKLKYANISYKGLNDKLVAKTDNGVTIWSFVVPSVPSINRQSAEATLYGETSSLPCFSTMPYRPNENCAIPCSKLEFDLPVQIKTSRFQMHLINCVYLSIQQETVVNICIGNKHIK